MVASPPWLNIVAFTGSPPTRTDAYAEHWAGGFLHRPFFFERPHLRKCASPKSAPTATPPPCLSALKQKEVNSERSIYLSTLCAPPSGGTRLYPLREYAGEMALIGEADLECDVAQGLPGVEYQLLRALHSL